MTSDEPRDHKDIVVECDLPEPPEKVWRAITQPEIVAAWLMPNDIKPEAGHRFKLGEEGHIDCAVIEAEPEQLLRYSWRERPVSGEAGFDSVVTFVLARTTTGGTHLRIVHDGFAAVAGATVMSGVASCSMRLHVATTSPTKTVRAANAPQWRLIA
ncbi:MULTISPECIES: SRPBCC family protein [Phyllobacteriaceae]|jgi:uncharacterized protein YndB with AHSA1/START domain|uniref:Activator of Hsp90 ATPase homologue 1/2-like C-terminal domain-containing protein n=1 Tax=Mesorhizobium hungaricum TaxID=1566387 RepID=A0A1C2DHR9_9HYPH|nr:MULTISPECIES: SRPBCC domain-containing protein [Mesorhizobium]MBN9235372.1 SRPBCC domain-containing protein [Mesorhizobium sp.]MDQ0332706.1 uncharacterized protein YndB with AHSA1/START domain [Mesorhizobium sp. YL-MeA3-2017]OCX14314.1 hypothetical protein QV13_17610 [Mesorhizobium hungaricum]